jgi:hypothetical protein
MFAYNPTVNDRSGEITAAGQIASANTQANMYNQLGNNIGGALASIGGMYGAAQERAQQGMQSLKVLKGLADSGYKPFQNIYTSLMSLGPKAATAGASEVVGDMGGWISQVMLSQMSTDRGRTNPYYAADARVRGQAALGQQTMANPMGGTTPVAPAPSGPPAAMPAGVKWDAFQYRQVAPATGP